MVDIVMGNHHAIETAHARAAQIGNDDARTGIGIAAKARTGVIKQRVVPGACHHGQALPDIQHRQP